MTRSLVLGLTSLRRALCYTLAREILNGNTGVCFVGFDRRPACRFLLLLEKRQELKEEAANLRKLTVLIIRALEEAGLAILNRDESGEPIGLVINADVHFGVKAGDTLRAK